MRPRTIILALVILVLFNGLIVFGVWLRFQFVTDGTSKELAASSTTQESRSSVSSVRASPSFPALRPASTTGAWAEIGSLQEGQSVPRKFTVSGRCGNIPDGNHLMLIVDNGPRVYSPKLPAAIVNGENWTAIVGEYGVPAGGTFYLCAFAISEEGFQQIVQWHAQGRTTGKWSPFRNEVPGGELLARIRLRVSR